MVNLTRIYTRTGDSGQTRLSDNTQVPKTDLRVQAYGQVDETNSALGVALAQTDVPQRLRVVLAHIQNELFDVGADISCPVTADPPWQPLRVDQASIDRLEAWCDEFGEQLPKLRSFILPGGTALAAQLHVARTLARSADRSAWAAAAQFGLAATPGVVDGGLNPLALTYLNRLSDLLFNLARHANQAASHDETLWVPGTGRTNPNAQGTR